MEKSKNVGRPPLKLDKSKVLEEVNKYLKNEQSGVVTYRNLGIGKTSFYRLLKSMEVKK